MTRTFSRFTSTAVILALVAVMALAFCGVAAAHPAGVGAPDSHSACVIGPHSPVGLASTPAQAPESTMDLIVTSGTGMPFDTVQMPAGRGTLASAELPPPADPRHGRTRT